jgi:LPPG:FO 2-phospho-L-lactate transferase
MAEGASLSEVTGEVARAFGLETSLLPATNDRVRTRVEIEEGWVSFQEYFVDRRHQDSVIGLEYQGADIAAPAPGVLEAIEDADIVLIGPSNPPLSIQPIVAIEEIRTALTEHPKVLAVSPLVGGKALKGPADRVMASLGYPPGTRGVVSAYRGMVDLLIVDTRDAGDIGEIDGVMVETADTLMPDEEASIRLAKELMGR